MKFVSIRCSSIITVLAFLRLFAVVLTNHIPVSAHCKRAFQEYYSIVLPKAQQVFLFVRTHSVVAGREATPASPRKVPEPYWILYELTADGTILVRKWSIRGRDVNGHSSNGQGIGEAG